MLLSLARLAASEKISVLAAFRPDHTPGSMQSLLGRAGSRPAYHETNFKIFRPIFQLFPTGPDPLRPSWKTFEIKLKLESWNGALVAAANGYVPLRAAKYRAPPAHATPL